MRLYLHRSISEKKFENVDLEKKSGIVYISTSVLFFRTEVVKLIILAAAGSFENA